MTHHRRVAFALGSAALFALSGEACSHTDALDFAPLDASPGAFSLDGAADTAPPDSGLIDYCPALHCPYPWATCPSSRFPCDVNLLNDPLNCGTCQFACPTDGTLNAVFSCGGGKCIPQCLENAFDCNGIPDDGCETALASNLNCSQCGDVCPDPDKPCIPSPGGKGGKCGCDVGKTTCDGVSCIDLSADDSNCGSCGNVCDPTGDGGALKPNEHLGCSASKCGAVKCDPGFADCDGMTGNGCEAAIDSDEHCGACNTVCPADTTCRVVNGVAKCLCPAGQTLCGENNCQDLQTSPANCGACGYDCTLAAAAKNGVGICKYGSCDFHCSVGWGDCNGDPQDGCEVNLSSDQNNCGACGNSCDVFGGQPCIAGQCAVEPCGDAGVPR